MQDMETLFLTRGKKQIWKMNKKFPSEKRNVIKTPIKNASFIATEYNENEQLQRSTKAALC